MCGNRVEELETRVQELEASVEGLTDELVECKVRLREMENAVDDESGFGTPAGRPSSNSAPQENGADEPEATPESEPEAEPESETESSDSEMLVPEPTTSKTGATDDVDKEAPADSESESDAESEDDSGSDIIVA